MFDHYKRVLCAQVSQSIVLTINFARLKKNAQVSQSMVLTKTFADFEKKKIIRICRLPFASHSYRLKIQKSVSRT